VANWTTGMFSIKKALPPEDEKKNKERNDQ